MNTAGETRKSFADIHDEEAFFHSVSDERSSDATVVAASIRSRFDASRRLKILDFGGGDGRFMEHLLRELRLAPSQLELAVVDLDDTYLDRYVAGLSASCASAIETYRAWPIGKQFDVVVASHVLYYVPSLHDWLKNLCDALLPGGICCATMGGNTTPMGRLWDDLFALTKRSSPFFGNKDLEHALAESALDFRVQDAPFSVEFLSSPENVAKFLRFLLGEHAHAIAPRAAEVLKDFIQDGVFSTRHVDLVYTIEKKKPLVR